MTLSLLEVEEGGDKEEDDNEEEEEDSRERDAADVLRMAETELDSATYSKFLQILVENENDGIKGVAWHRALFNAN